MNKADINALIEQIRQIPTETSEAYWKKSKARDDVREALAALTGLTTERDRMKKALDDIYNHNAATRAAVIMYYGLWHLSDD